MTDNHQTERRGVEVRYENEEIAEGGEGVEQNIRSVHRSSVTVKDERSFLLGFLTGSAYSLAIVGATAYFLKKYFGEIARPLAPNCIIYEVSVPKKGKKSIDAYVSGGHLKNDLQKSFKNVEKKLRQILGDEYSQVNPDLVEAIKKTKITSVELCDQETLQKAWQKFWQIQDEVAPATPKPTVSLGDKLRKIFGEKIPESKLKAIVQTFKDLGVGDAGDFALLTEADVAQKFGGDLSLVEHRRLMKFVKGHPTPLPPSQLRLSSPEYPNTVLTVFFDDPNKMMCDYLVTALDMESWEEISVESSSNFGVLKDLKPGRRYVIFAQCISNDVRSKKTFFGEPINVYGRDAISGEGPHVYPTKMMQSVPSVPSGSDSAYMSETRGQAKRRKLAEETGPGSDEISVAPTQSEMPLGDEAATIHKIKEKDSQRIWETPIHEEMKGVFPEMSELDMENLLQKIGEMGIQRPDDFRYVKEPHVANKLEGTLKIVELEKLKEYVERTYTSRAYGPYGRNFSASYGYRPQEAATGINISGETSPRFV